MKARVALKVRAGASRTQFAGIYANSWKLQVAAPPVDGKANEVIIRFLAKLASVPASAVRIVTGQTSSMKQVEIEGISPEHLNRVILEANGPRQNSGITPPPES